MNRSSVPIFSLPARSATFFLGLVFAAALGPAPARADNAPTLWFAGTRLILDHPQMRDGEVAVSTSDSGLEKFLARLGATLSYAPGQRYIVIATGDRRTIRFTLGDAHVDAGGVVTSTPFAPYTSGGIAYLPLFSLARALYVQPMPDGRDEVLQPQFGGLDVRSDAHSSTVVMRGAYPLVVKSSGDRLVFTFNGIGSSLEADRAVNAPGLTAIHVQTSGPARNPTTTVTFAAPAGATHALVATESANDIEVVFSAPGLALSEAPPAAPSAPGAAEPESSVAPSNDEPQSPTPAGLANVTSVALAPGDDGRTTVKIALDGTAHYDWHRLLDGRWYVDIENATLGFPPRDESPSGGGVASMRIRQFAVSPVPIVRVSLSLASTRGVDVSSVDGGLAITVAPSDDPSPVRIGAGQIGGADVAQASPPAQPWKFTPPAAVTPGATNPRLIVIDPGHGGSDPGAQHNGLTEKDVALDISRRLRTILVARGWTVKMTRDADYDVFAPNDSARDELQTRDDIANGGGARLFLSVHINSYVTSSLNGTTVYYYKGSDLALAQALHRRLSVALETKDDGVRKDNLYVIRHAAMPAALVETAFISNAHDAALLRSSAFLQKVATAIADGVADYVSTPSAANLDPADQ